MRGVGVFSLKKKNSKEPVEEFMTEDNGDIEEMFDEIHAGESLIKPSKAQAKSAKLMVVELSEDVAYRMAEKIKNVANNAENFEVFARNRWLDTFPKYEKDKVVVDLYDNGHTKPGVYWFVSENPEYIIQLGDRLYTNKVDCKRRSREFLSAGKSHTIYSYKIPPYDVVPISDMVTWSPRLVRNLVGSLEELYKTGRFRSIYRTDIEEYQKVIEKFGYEKQDADEQRLYPLLSDQQIATQKPGDQRQLPPEYQAEYSKKPSKKKRHKDEEEPVQQMSCPMMLMMPCQMMHPQQPIDQR